MWDYYTEPVPSLGGLTPNLWQGRILGGSSGINAMIYCRGASSVFDEWAEISGNEGLAWESLLEDFRATTHYEDEPVPYSQVVDTSVMGDGPLAISRGRELVEFDVPFADALKSTLNLPEIDLIDGTGLGVSFGLQSIRASNRTRSYAYNTYGYLMANRPNVQILHNAWVQRIGFSDQTAQNVTYTDTLNNQTYVINSKEIIVAAGTLNSPHLLMLSGVGPQDQLSALKIPVVADILEVGSNLYDHHYSVMQF